MSKLLALISSCLIGLTLPAAQVQLAWDPNPELNIAGYRIYRGTSPGIYSTYTDVGNVTTAVVASLTANIPYYFALSAYNTDLLESPLSPEISALATGPNTSGPLATPASYTLAEDVSLPITLAGSDPNNGALSFVIVTQPSRGTLSGTPPRVTYVPAANFSGSDSFSFVVSAAGVLSAPASIALAVAPANDRPVGFPQSRTVAEDGSLSITLGGGDVDGDPITFSIRTQPTRGVLTGTPPNLTYRPTANYSGPDSFSFLVNDGRLLSGATTVSISVLAQNDVPTATAQSISLSQGGTATVTLGGSDVDGDALTYRVRDLPLNGTLAGTAPNLVYTPNPGFAGSDRFTFTASDAVSTSPAATVQLTIAGVTANPTARSQSIAMVEDRPQTITLTGLASAGLPLTFTVRTLPANGTLTGTPPLLVYTPAKDYFGPDSFTFTVREGSSDSPPATISLNIQAVNDTPIAATQSFNLVKDTQLDFTLSALDPDRDPVSFAIVQPPTKGTLLGTPPQLSYVPNPGYTGPDSFTYVASDASTQSLPATVSLSIDPINPVPRGLPDLLVVTQGGDTTQLADDSFSVLDNDPDDLSGLSRTAHLVASPSNGSLTFALDGRFHYTHDGGLFTEDSFTYQISRDGVLSDPITVRVSIFRWTQVTRGGTQIDLRFSTVSGLSYDFESTQDIPRPTGVWSTVFSSLEGIDSPLKILRPNPTAITYYRAVCQVGGKRIALDPVAYFPIGVQNGFNLVSSPLHVFPTHVANVVTVSRDTATFGASFWQAGQFDPKDGFSQYVLVVRAPGSNSPSRAGDWWPVVLTGTDRLKLETRGADLRLELQMDDEVEVRRLTTLAELFSTPSGAASFVHGDRVTLYSPLGLSTDLSFAVPTTGPGTFYTLNPDQSLRAPVAFTSPALLPGVGFQFNRVGNALVQPILGRLQSFGLTHYVANGIELVATPFPISTTLERSGLLQAGFVNEVVSSTQPKDEFWFIESASPIAIVTRRSVPNQSNPWYANGVWSPNQSLAPSKAAWFILAPRTSPYRWRQPVPW